MDPVMSQIELLKSRRVAERAAKLDLIAAATSLPAIFPLHSSTV